ncbi:MAG: toll/interleukin-1 receptor domain-containing protein [Chloroflexota bacterium]
MSQIFISYSRLDLDFVQKIVEQLRRRNYRVWLDKTNIKPGSKWQEAITSGVKASTGMIAFLSPNSVVSEWCGIEIDTALDAGLTVIPYVYRKCDLPSRLKSINAIFHSEPGAVDKLIAALDKLPEGAKMHSSKILEMDLIGNPAKTFREAAAFDPGCLSFSVTVGQQRINLIGLPLKASKYCSTYLVGRAEDTLEWQPKAQLAMQFSQAIPGDHFPLGIALNFLDSARNDKATLDFKLRMFLVRGPLQITYIGSAYQTNYGLDVTAPDEWQDAIRAADEALKVYAKMGDRPALQIFNVGPGALLYPLGLGHKNAYRAEVYQHSVEHSRYFRVFGNID